MKKAKFFDLRIGKISALTFFPTGGGVPEAHKRLFTGALEELRTSLEELQIAEGALPAVRGAVCRPAVIDAYRNGPHGDHYRWR